MKEKGLRIRKTKEAWRADYKTTTTIQAMSDSEAFSLFFLFGFLRTGVYMRLVE